MKNKTELLAPAGDKAAFFAAVQSGANAVYIGGKLFNARQYSTNFEIEEIAELVKYAHIRGVKVYVTLNIIIKNEEIVEAVRYVAELFNASVDAIIIQDLGLLYIVNNLFKGKEFHASTQMSIQNSAGVNYLYEKGIKRTVLAREVSLSEIKKIKLKTKAELEVFIHGALCNAYSGQCLMSSMLGERSGNRGRCAQPCRLPYKAVQINTENELSQELYLLSPRDLCTIDSLDEMVEAGVDSIKIEGRMKKPEYVATVVKQYRDKLDGNYNEAEKSKLYQAFNRDFTKGHLFDEYGTALMSTDKPNNKGVYIGKVKMYKQSGSLILKLERTINIGDGIELRKENESIGMSIDKIIAKDETKMIYEIPVARRDYSDMKVYLTNDSQLNKDIKSDLETEIYREILNFDIKVKIGAPIYISVTNESMQSIEVQSEYIVEKAQKNGVDEERILVQLNKLGGTIYEIGKFNSEIEENCFVPAKELNELRRKIVEHYDGLKMNLIENIDVDEIETKCIEILSKEKSKKTKTKISVKIRDIEMLNSIDFTKIDRIYIPLEKWNEEVSEQVKDKAVSVYLYLDRIYHELEYDQLEIKIKDMDLSFIDGISVSNLGQINLAKKYKENIHGDLGLNIFNDLAIKFLKSEGFSSYTPSNEMTLTQVNDLYDTGIEKEAVVYGHIAMMYMKNCPFSVLKECDKKCETCRYHIGMGLLDRKNIIFPIENFKNYSILYNAKSLFLGLDVNKLVNRYVDILRLDFTIENQAQIAEIIDYHYNIINDVEGRYPWIVKKTDEKYFTKGHYFRGVL